MLTASLAEATGKSGYITELSLKLGASGCSRQGAYLTADCPAPNGFGGATFPFARATFEFAHSALDSTLVRKREVRR